MNQPQYQGPERRQSQTPYQGEERRKSNSGMGTQGPKDEQEDRTRQQQKKRDDTH